MGEAHFWGASPLTITTSKRELNRDKGTTMQDFFKQQSDWLKTWQDSQQKLTEQYANWTGKWMENTLGKQEKEEPDFFENWFQAQRDLVDQFNEFSKHLHEMINCNWGDKVPADVLKLLNFGFFEEFYKNWLSNLKFPGGMQNPLNMFGGWPDTTNFFYSFMGQDNPFFSVFNKAQFTEDLDQVLGMLQSGWAPGLSPFNNILTGYRELFGQLYETTTAQSVEKFAESFETWKKEMEKYLLAPKVGVNREITHEISKGLMLSLDYVQSYGRMARRVEATFRKAGSRFQAKLSELALKDKPVPKFTDFYTLWTDENEAVFREVLNSKEFAKIQGEFTNAGNRMKIQWRKLAEKALESTPIALNRDLDLAIAEIHQLKRDMRSLKRELKEKEKETRKAREAQATAEETAKMAKAIAEKVAKEAKTAPRTPTPSTRKTNPKAE